MSDVAKGDADGAVQVLQLGLELGAQLEVQGSEGLVEQEDIRPVHESAGERDPLLLSTRELIRTSMLTPLEAHELDRLRYPTGNLVTGPACLAQAEGDVLPHVEVRKQRVALEYRVDRSPVWPHGRDVASTDVDRPLGWLLEAGDHPQSRGLAAARRADDREELAALDFEVEGADRLQVAEPLGDGGKADRGAAAGHP